MDFPSSQGELRRRKTSSSKTEGIPSRDDSKDSKKSEEIVWGKTPSGEVFQVPTTHDVLTLFHPGYPKSHLDILSLFLLGLQIVLLVTLPRSISQPFFLCYFAFWRIAYDAGLGWVLTLQSKKKWIVREVARRGWLEESKRPKMRAWIRKQLQVKMGKDYSFDNLPAEYNTWLLFRQLVDIILLNDFLSYCIFAFCCFRVPEGLSMPVHILRWVGGIILIAFNLWVKTEAHHVVKDYGWYWGDVFFQRGALVFDGVFELAPHPMYSVGYAGYYGLSLIVGSYPVLFASLAGHAAQFGFLVFFENPHIERTYGQRKPLASRIPVIDLSQSRMARSRRSSAGLSRSEQPVASFSALSDVETTPTHNRSVSSASITSNISTPSITEGETATETELETETEHEGDGELEGGAGVRRRRKLGGLGHFPDSGASSRDFTRVNSPKGTGSQSPVPSRSKLRVISQHDLLNRYFRKDLLILHNIDLLRVQDFQLAVLTVYVVAFATLPPLSHKELVTLHFIHALLWRVYHTFVLGSVLKAQSQSKFVVRHFLKHYHYPDNDGGRGAITEAFTNWKGLYNLSLCMTYASFFGLAWKCYKYPAEWIAGDQLLRHTLGAILIALHIWAAQESYNVLGVFGWFFGDFFIEDYPATLEYTGIFRFLNNPEILSGATFCGLALITGSRVVLALAAISYMSYWWFLRTVENPHMRKLYGDALRKDAGFTKIIKKVAEKNARMIESRAGKHAPEIKRVAQEVKGSFNKVFEETEEIVKEFLNRSTPTIQGVVQDTKVLLQQSREKLVITRVASDISSFDTQKYHISVTSNKTSGKYRFHLGEPITVFWNAPASHSRRDWIGIYRLGANKSSLVTTTSSLGMWQPVHDDEWDGDNPIGFDRQKPGEEQETGKVIFKGDTLPWHVGTYEVRYHHDGKYNVMSLDGPIEIYVDPPASLDFQSVRWYLIHIVSLCLDSDPSLVPLSSRPPGTPSPPPTESEGRERDPDDFRFWSERQAKRIAVSIKQAFNVEYDSEVILADANVSALTNRILVSKELLSA